MGNLNSHHLSPEQIHQLLQPDRDETFVDADVHLQGCAECRAALSRHAIEADHLRLLENVEPVAPQPTCPDDVRWASVLAGILPAAEIRKYLQHAMECDACSLTLKRSADALDAEVSEEDSRFLSSLHISSEAGQRTLAERLAATQAAPASAKRSAVPRWIPVFAAAAMAAFLVFGLYPAWQARQAQTIIAQQFRKGRPFEFRLDNVPYGPLTVTRNGGADGKSALPEFVHAATGGWRADLLEGDPSAAIDRLEKLRQSGNSSLTVLSDLAAAYAIRGDQLRSNDDYTRALALLRELQTQDPGHPSGWFNQALVFERLSRSDEMRASLETFLRFETDTGWRTEAQTLLAR